MSLLRPKIGGTKWFCVLVYDSDTKGMIRKLYFYEFRLANRAAHKLASEHGRAAIMNECGDIISHHPQVMARSVPTNHHHTPLRIEDVGNRKSILAPETKSSPPKVRRKARENKW